MNRALVTCLAGMIGGAAALVGATAGLGALASPAAAASTTVPIQQAFADPMATRDFDVSGPGTWAVSAGHYRVEAAATAPGSGAARSLSIHRTTVAGPSWRLETSVRPTGSFPSVSAVVLDYRDPDDYSFVQLAAAASGSGVFAVRSGVTTKVAPLTVALPSGATSTVELRKEAAVLKVYVARPGATIAYVGKATLSEVTSGRIGYAEVSGDAEFDDLSVTTSSPAPTSTPTSTSTPDPAPFGGRAVTVATGGQLTAALADARPGDVITMADGVYTSDGPTAPVSVGGKRYAGTFVAVTPGTADRPIVLQGSRLARIDGRPGGDGTGTQYGLYLVGASHWQIKGITVANVSKGVVLDRTQHSLVEGLEVRDTGQEGIHLRAGSSDNIVRDSTVRRTGLLTPAYGEGIYVGSASSNWATYSDGAPDASDRNQLLRNTISETTAESVDVKEGTTAGVISGNSLDGAGMTGGYADSWIDVKGNDWVVSGNRGGHALLDGFQVHGALDGWGNGNAFRDNVADVEAAGYGFRVQGNVTGTVVACSNTVTHAGSGFANVACG